MMYNDTNDLTPTAKKVTLLCLVLSSLILLFDIFIPLGVAVGVLYVVVIMLSLRVKLINITLIFGVLCTLLILTGYYLSPPGGEQWKVISNRFLSVFAIWAVAVMGLHLKRMEEELNQSIIQRENIITELKVLQGLLHICSQCKKIRDDHGQWKHMESYIRDHSEAEFSHGLCLDCATSLYPELNFEKSDKS